MMICRDSAIDILKGKLEGIRKGYVYGYYKRSAAKYQADGSISICRDLNLISHEEAKRMYFSFCHDIDSINLEDKQEEPSEQKEKREC